MVWNADTDRVVMVVIKVMKIRIFREYQSKLAGDIFSDEWFGSFGDDAISVDFSFIFWH